MPGPEDRSTTFDNYIMGYLRRVVQRVRSLSGQERINLLGYSIGGTFNEVGWNVINMLNAADKDRAIKLLFDATDGARFQHGRIPIGASDYAKSRYPLNDTANDTTHTDTV